MSSYKEEEEPDSRQVEVTQLDTKEESEEYQSQPTCPPTALSHLSPFPMAEASPEVPLPQAPAAPSPPPPDPRYNQPTFAPGPNTPKREELVKYAKQVEQYIHGICFTLHYLHNDSINWPADINLTVISSMTRTTAAIWETIFHMGEHAGEWERRLAKVKLSIAQKETAQAHAVSIQLTPQQSHLKTPMPTKFNGTKGNPALTFMAACMNYQTMEPTSFTDDNQYIQWVLQQVEGKAGLWATTQLT